MFYDPDQPDVSLREWEAFRKEYPRHLIVEVIDRSEAKLPDCLVPFARGVAIASDDLLRDVGYRPGMYRPRDWRKTHCDVFVRDIGPKDLEYIKRLIVRQCNNQGLWTVERWNEKRRYQQSDEILVHEFGATPIFTRSYQSTMQLAMYSHENGPPPGLRWISACPENYQDAIDERRADEVLARRNVLREDYLRLE